MLHALRRFLSCRENKTAVFFNKDALLRVSYKPSLSPCTTNEKPEASSCYHGSKLLVSAAVLCYDAAISFILWGSLYVEINNDVYALPVCSLIDW